MLKRNEFSSPQTILRNVCMHSAKWGQSVKSYAVDEWQIHFRTKKKTAKSHGGHVSVYYQEKEVIRDWLSFSTVHLKFFCCA